MPEGHRIRRAGPGDAETLAALGWDTYVETFVEGFAIPYPPEDLAVFKAQSYSAAYNRPRLADPTQAIWLAEDVSGRAVAYAAAGGPSVPHADVRPQDGELKALYVRRDAQGSGLGRTLLDLALGWLEPAGARTLWLSVWSGNHRAQRLYEAHGFHKAGEYAFPVGRWRDREFIFRREPGMVGAVIRQSPSCAATPVNAESAELHPPRPPTLTTFGRCAGKPRPLAIR